MGRHFYYIFSDRIKCMSRFIPFTAHIRIVPNAGDKRFENIRDMQNIATLMYAALNGNTSLSLASPGGGQHQSMNGIGGGLSGLTNGMAVKPQIGESPAQAMITGYHIVDNKNFQPHPEHELISGGEIFSGPGQAVALHNPTTMIDDGVKNLKLLIENELDSELPNNITYSVFRIDYSGVVFGDKGYHFPR